MKKNTLALAALALLPALSFAQSITIGSASGTAGGNATTGVPIAVTFAQNATLTPVNTVVDIDNRLTYSATNLTLVVGAGTIPGGSCTILSPGNINVSVPNTGNVTIANGTICTITSVAIAAAAPASNALVIGKGLGSGCTNAAGNTSTCAYNNGAVTTGGGGNTNPTLAYVVAPGTAVNFPAGAAGAATATIAVTPSGAAGTGSTSVTGCAVSAILPAGAVFAAPTTTPANGIYTNVAGTVNLGCTRAAAAATATLTCNETPNGGAAVVRTWPLACPAGTAPPTTSITYQLAPGTPGAPAPIGFPQGAGGAVGTVINAAFNVTGNNFAVGQTGSVGACTFAADPTPTAPAVSDPAAFAGFTQLTFNNTNSGTNPGTAQSFGGSCTRRVTAVSAIMSCPETQPSNAVNPVARVYRVGCPLGTLPPITVTATTPASGSTTTLTGQPVGGGTSSQVLTFGATGAGTMNCAITPAAAGYSVAPLVVNLTAAGPNTATVTFTGTTSGTFTGTAVCTPVAPGATGGPFTYNFSTTVAAPVAVPTIAVPSLNSFGLLALIAGFLGLGMVLVNRRQA
jgi:hypothetical protein